MKERYLQVKQVVQDRIQMARNQVNTGIRQHWYKALFLVFAAVLLTQKDLSINLQMSAAAVSFNKEPENNREVVRYSKKDEEARPVTTAHRESPRNISQTQNSKKNKGGAAIQENALSGLTVKAPRRVLSPEEQAKRKKQLAYVKRFSKVAQTEMEKYGIPASITLAQGLLESNNGQSRLATKNHNHFGIKCFSRSCKKGHCSNFSDDSHKDFFRKYNSAWESYRAHSVLLQKDRYKPLYKYKKTTIKAGPKV